MSNTISPSNPNIINLHEEVGMWQYPVGVEAAQNPAEQARAEYEHGLYVDALAAPDTDEIAQPAQAIEGRAAVAGNQFETVPAAGELHGYATSTGNAIDPARADAVFAATAEVFDTYAAADTPEVVHTTAEYNAAAASQANAYGTHLDDIRKCALEDWGAEGEV